MWDIIASKRNEIFHGLSAPFYLLWCGETISVLGGGLLEFALGVWVYQKTASVLDFSGVVVASVLPMLIVAPFAGKVVDRFDRRYIMVVSDVAVFLLAIVLACLISLNSIEIDDLYIFIVLLSVISSFRMTAYQASVSEVLPKEKYTQASGLMNTSESLLSVFTPLMAGVLMAAIGLLGVVVIDLVTFGVGAILIYKAFFGFYKTVPQIDRDPIHAANNSFTVARAFFKSEPLMTRFLCYVALLDAMLVLVSTMIMPLVLSVYPVQELGVILAFGSLGGLCGAVMLVVIPDQPAKLMTKVLLADAVLSCSILIAGVSTSFQILCLCAFVALLAAALSKGGSQSLWMRKVPLQSQGRIFSIITAVGLSTSLVMLLLGSIFVEKVLEPRLVGGALLEAVASWRGTAQGSALGMVFMLCGLLGVLLSLRALKTPLTKIDLLVADVK